MILDTEITFYKGNNNKYSPEFAVERSSYQVHRGNSKYRHHYFEVLQIHLPWISVAWKNKVHTDSPPFFNLFWYTLRNLTQYRKKLLQLFSDRYEMEATYSSTGPVYFGLFTNITFKRSARHLIMCMNRSNGVDAGFVVYITCASPKFTERVVGML